MRRALAILGSLTAIGCGPESAPRAPVAQVEAELKQVLDRWYDAMQRFDSAGTVAPLTRDFLLLEDTVPMAGPELGHEIAAGKAANDTWTSERTGFRTRVAGDVAWTTFENHETRPVRADSSCSADFLETVVFVKDRTGWLIDRYHAAARRRRSC